MSALSRLHDKVALVSGAASGIGLATARRLTEEGACVVLADLDAETGASRAEELGTDRAHFAELDVTDPGSWAAVVHRSLDRFGQLDGLVNCAGVGGGGSLCETSEEDWRRVMSVNLDGVFFGMRAALPALLERETSSVVNISSIAGLVGFKGSAAYAASKWGVHGLTKTAALELGEHGVRVNSVHPGSIATPLTAGLTRGIGQIPAGRVGAPEEIAHLVVHLVSDESRFTNGASIAVDGGETAGNSLRGLL
ncbi:SDR family NAD(P)-dependent oxidoreductase [Brevibacterium album]|uniref:SDR family NAD(P)-dependent oxidoreductase n=1 Tax=Brevibacterium album TaxID=417948 RepID=UPI00041C2E0A|nr:SDR family oxidoreductase [Brevibacterium album]